MYRASLGKLVQNSYSQLSFLIGLKAIKIYLFFCGPLNLKFSCSTISLDTSKTSSIKMLPTPEIESNLASSSRPKKIISLPLGKTIYKLLLLILHKSMIFHLVNISLNNAKQLFLKVVPYLLQTKIFIFSLQALIINFYVIK